MQYFISIDSKSETFFLCFFFGGGGRRGGDYVRGLNSYLKIKTNAVSFSDSASVEEAKSEWGAIIWGPSQRNKIGKYGNLLYG